jgi:hypothetical protein
LCLSSQIGFALAVLSKALFSLFFPYKNILFFVLSKTKIW